MSLARRLGPLFTTVLTHPLTRDARRLAAEASRRLRREPHRLHYFHQADDPYSHLAAQVLEPLLRRYDVELVPHLVGPPPEDAAPERERLEEFARKDAADVAPGYGLEFPRLRFAPGREDADLARRLLVGAIDTGSFAERAAEIGLSLWAGDRAGLEKCGSDVPPASSTRVRQALEKGDAERRRLGHYLGAMLHYGGEWYWGVDRLWHLERRLQALGLLRPGEPSGPLAPRPDFSNAPPLASERRLTLEFFPSLRSPYTAISMRRVMDLPSRLPVDVVFRPVLPMVMRGLPVPSSKRIYIVLDTAREAADAGEAFGRICDPVGEPVERGLSLFPWARDQGRGEALLASFTRAAFSEGIDTGSDDGLRHVVERAGLSWEAARPHLADESWRGEVEQNRRMLFECGLWGVPSFRLLGENGDPEFSTWGQDRIWLVEQEIRRRLATA